MRRAFERAAPESPEPATREWMTIACLVGGIGAAALAALSATYWWVSHL